MTSTRPERSVRQARIRRVVQLAVTVALASTTVGVADAESVPERQAFDWSFRCDGLGGLFNVDASTVRSEGNIPPEFRLLGESGGTAVLFLAAFDCDPAVVDGAEVPFLYSLATVFLDPADASHPGSYDFFKFTDSSRVHSRFGRMGVWIRHLEQMSVDIGETAPLHGEAYVPWNESLFTLYADGAPGVPVPDGAPSDHWSAGRHGVTYGADFNCAGRADPAVVTAQATPGTPIARILGGTTVTAPGAFLRLSAAGQVAFEGQTQRPTECPTWE